MMLLRFYRSCSLCLLFIGILLGTTSVTGSPIAGISPLERCRGRPTAQVRIGYYRTSKAEDPKTMGWVQHHKKNEEDIECICFGIENANCFGLQIGPNNTMQALHVTTLKMHPSRQSSPDTLYFLAQNHLSLKQSVLAKWKLQGYTTVWDLLNDIPEVQEQIWASTLLNIPVHDQESYIELIKEYLIMVGIIVETQ